MKISMNTTGYSITLLATLLLFLVADVNAQRKRESFNGGWKFISDTLNDYSQLSTTTAGWRSVRLPHDWSIELPFDSTSPTGTTGGALRGGTGWYHKTFSLPVADSNKSISIDFDGIYLNSEVWVNGHYLGLRPYGYSSFRYTITPYLKFGKQANVITVKVNNLKQPNSRWYSGSGIYRNVWLVTTGKIAVDHWGTFITTPMVSKQVASVHANSTLRNITGNPETISLNTIIYDQAGKIVANKSTPGILLKDSITELEQDLKVASPRLWSDTRPYLYKVVTQVMRYGKVADEYTTSLGIRHFQFDTAKGFLLNGMQVKINGVCDHHDLGCLGTAINTRALERKLEILRSMGCNGIRTSHNPPAPELLDLCDKMGFIVMDEAFDMWKKEKKTYDYHLFWDQWHKRDLEDLIRRDRNHPCVFVWSIGNEIPEQWDSSGIAIGAELGRIIKDLDSTRPVTSAMNDPQPKNYIYRSGALDLVGFNYRHQEFSAFPKNFPGKKFIGTETVSALETRGHYDLIPSDSIRRWPKRWDLLLTDGNKDLTVSAYDNVSSPWGSTHEETWKEIRKYDFLSGQYIWTGFDYIGEPTPYPWPARSSYFGIVDLAGFPKDVYYMYQSEWTHKNVLHIFPHWNWKQGDTTDVWAYYNNADEVELFLNNQSVGVRKKKGDELHVVWRLPFVPGTLKAVSRKNGSIVLVKAIKTAGTAYKIQLTADRSQLKAGAQDLSFVKVSILDKEGNLVPDADNLVKFKLTGPAFIAGTDNGNQVSMESFKLPEHKAFHGLCLAVVQEDGIKGTVILTATSPGLVSSSITLSVK